jgi:hypothetical protein
MGRRRISRYRLCTLSLPTHQHIHSTHRKHGRRKEHNKPPRQSRRGAQTPSSPEAARTKARSDERKPLSWSDELCIGYVALGRIAFIGVQMLSKTMHMFKNKTLTSCRLLGIFRPSSSRMRQPGKRAASMHGLKGKKATWTSRTENVHFADTFCYNRNPQTTPRTRSTSTSPASIPRSSDRTRGSSRRALDLILAYTHSEIGMALRVYKRGCLSPKGLLFGSCIPQKGGLLLYQEGKCMNTTRLLHK